MTATLNDVTKKKEPVALSAEQQAATELVRLAREQGVSLSGPDGLLKQLTKTVIETALGEEMTEHLGYEKHDPAGAGTGNVRRRHAWQVGVDRGGRPGRYRCATGPGRNVRASDREEAPAAT